MSSKSSQNEVTAIIVLHNNKKTIGNCLKHLLRGSVVPRVLIIDCGSKDGGADAAREYLKARFSDKEEKGTPYFVVELGVNTGRAHAFNTGVHMVSTPYVFSLSPEAAVSRRYVEKLLGCMKKLEKSGLHPLSVQGLITAGTGSGRGTTIRSAGWKLRPDYICVHVAEGKDAGAFRDPGRVRRIPASDMSASLYRMAALSEVGLMDERLFGFNEDLDLGLRSSLLGHQSYLLPTAAARSYGPAEQTLFEKQVIIGNLLYMQYKYNRPAILQNLLNNPAMSEDNGGSVRRGRTLCYMAEMEQMEREQMDMSVTKLPLPDEFYMNTSWADSTLIYPLWLGERLPAPWEKTVDGIVQVWEKMAYGIEELRDKIV